MPKTLDLIRGNVPDGIFKAAEAMVKAVKRDSFVVVTGRSEDGQIVYILATCTQLEGGKQAIQPICELIDQGKTQLQIGPNVPLLNTAH